MRVRLSPFVAALVLGLSLRGSARAEDAGSDAPKPAGNVRTDADHDFEWRVPDTWELSDPSEDDQKAGFVAKARRVVSPGVEIAGFVVVRDSAGASLEENIAQVKANKSKTLKDAKVEDAVVTWASSPLAKSLRISGKAENGSAIVWFVRAAIVSGKYHQLDLRATNGAHTSQQGEIDAAIAGYRVLSAAPAAPADGGDGSAGAAPDPLTKSFPQLSLTWTLPKDPTTKEAKKTIKAAKEGDPDKEFLWGFAGAGNPLLEKGSEGTLAVAGLVLGSDTVIDVQLSIHNSNQSDPDVVSIVKNDGNFDNIAKSDFDGVPIPQIDEDAKVGNVRGAFHTMSGKSKTDGKPLWMRFYFVTVQTQLYRLWITARDGYETKEGEWLTAVRNGLQWSDTKSGVRGPLIAPFATASSPRKEWLDLNKKRAVKGAVSFTKPPQFGELKREGADRWVVALECRKGDAYLFVGILRYDNKLFGGATPKKEPESLIDDHENDWKNGVDEPVTRGKSGKSNRKPDSFRAQAGSTYEFSGKKNGFPFLERGWVFTAKQSVYWVRAQYGGKDAEKALESDWKDFTSTVRFE